MSPPAVTRLAVDSMTLTMVGMSTLWAFPPKRMSIAIFMRIVPVCLAPGATWKRSRRRGSEPGESSVTVDPAGGGLSAAGEGCSASFAGSGNGSLLVSVFGSVVGDAFWHPAIARQDSGRASVHQEPRIRRL